MRGGSIGSALTLAALCATASGCADAAPAQPSPSTPAAPAFWPAPVSYDVGAAWSARRRLLRGTTRITLRNDGPAPMGSAWLRTWPNAFGSCRRPLARVAVTAGGRLARDRHRCSAREVRLEPRLEPGARTTLALRFSVRVPRRSDRFGVTAGTAYLGSALPTLAVRDEDGWRLPPYTGEGEAWFTLTAPWRVTLSLPRKLRLAATGRQESARALPDGRRQVTTVTPAARDFAMAIGRFRVATTRLGDITLRHHRLAGTARSTSRHVLHWAGAALERFSAWWGPYGRSELDLVEGPDRLVGRGIAMEYPELVLVPAGRSAVAHEVAHQWWAMLMGNDPWREPWLDESFAEYAQARLPDEDGGRDRLGACRPPARPPRPPLRSTMGRFERARADAYLRVVYLGGACTLRRLERAFGRARLDGVLARLVSERRDGTWTTADFVGAVRAAAPGGFDVDAFLRSEGLR